MLAVDRERRGVGAPHQRAGRDQAAGRGGRGPCDVGRGAGPRRGPAVDRGPVRRSEGGGGHPDASQAGGRPDHQGRQHPGRVDHRQRRLREGAPGGCAPVRGGAAGQAPRRDHGAAGLAPGRRRRVR
jgi:hypothetical protein